MKYYTKEWYNLMGARDYTAGMKKISDKDYSDREIQTFYDKALKKAINRARKEYNSPPDSSLEFEMLEKDEFRLDDWVVVDDMTGVGFIPHTKDEVRSHLEDEQERAEREFENRPPFDLLKEISDFELTHRFAFENLAEHLPKWVLGQVDWRLLGLYLLPKSVYCRLRQEERRNRKEFNRIDKRAINAVWRAYSKLPEKMQTQLGFHDANILEFHKKRKDYEMLLRLDGGDTLEGNTPYKRVVYLNATLLEKEKGIITSPYQENGIFYSQCRFLYEEIYGLKDGRYEVHMMVHCNDLKYITLQCEDILFEDNIEYPKQV